MKKKNPWNTQLLLGLFIIVVGVLFVMDNLGMIYAWDYLRYWPAILVVFGVAKLSMPNHSKFWAWTFIIVGGLLFMDRLGMIDFRIQAFILPGILIGIGGLILWNSLTRQSARTVILNGEEGTSDESFLDLSAFMGGFEKKITSKDFRGGKITTVMGGAELDLRKAVIAGDEAVLETFVVMGGIELQVPENWQVIIQGVPVMGAFSDETRPAETKDMKRFIIQGNVVMGAIEIKN